MKHLLMSPGELISKEYFLHVYTILLYYLNTF